MDKERALLIKQAEAALELKARYDNRRIEFYQVCCAVHGGRKPDTWPLDTAWWPEACPVFPCPDSKHTAFHMSKARNRVVFGGNRSSKTYTCWKEVVYRMTAKEHPFTKQPLRRGDRHGRVLAQDYSLHEKKHIPEAKEWIPTNFLKAFKPGMSKHDAWEKSYDSRNHLLHLKNNSWLDFQTYEQDSSKGESVDLDVWFADEEIPEDWYQACNSRIITRGGVGIMGVTPLYGLSWARRFLDSPNPNVEVFKWGIRDNPYNSEKAINDFLADVSPLERESRESGDFIEFKGIRYKDLSPAVHLVGSKQPDSSNYVIMSMDPHPRKGTAITWAFLDGWDRVTFFDELLIQGDAKAVVAAIREREASHKARTLLRVADPAIEKQFGFGSDLTTHDEFQRCGMSFSLADNSEAGYGVVEEYIRYDKSREISSLNQPMLYFTEDCKQLWYSMTHLMWDEYKFGANRDPKEKVKDKDKDFADCVRYTLVSRPSMRSQNIQPVSLRFNTGR